MAEPRQEPRARAKRHLANLRVLVSLKEEILRNRLAAALASSPTESAERILHAIVVDAHDEKRELEEVGDRWGAREGSDEVAKHHPSVSFDEHVLALMDVKRESARRYRQAGMDCPDAALRRKLFKLARREEEHVQVLEGLVKGKEASEPGAQVEGTG